MRKSTPCRRCSRAIKRLQHNHLAAELAQHRRSLEPDVAAADHNDPRRARRQFLAHPVDIGLVTHGMNAAEFAPQARKTPRVATCRPYQSAVRDRHAAGDGELLRSRVDLADSGAEPQRDAIHSPELRQADQDALEWRIASKVFLRQRRTFIGQLGVPADHQDRPLEAVLAQRDRRLGPAMPGADNDSIVAVRLGRDHDASDPYEFADQV